MNLSVQGQKNWKEFELFRALRYRSVLRAEKPMIGRKKFRVCVCTDKQTATLRVNANWKDQRQRNDWLRRGSNKKERFSNDTTSAKCPRPASASPRKKKKKKKNLKLSVHREWYPVACAALACDSIAAAQHRASSSICKCAIDDDDDDDDERLLFFPFSVFLLTQSRKGFS
ncbi:hypothetical protein OUZ56_019044 [Daphnia magna]|uniref:Uncharacterized protein n=1 Tax=Daphnia magna TaxID=35525 RepID=A0ABQ9ZAH4_9CRUS|nr:hypothetical protein OUZ56_019044 [Daphnia magna]